VAAEECGPMVYICCAKLPLGFLHPVGSHFYSSPYMTRTPLISSPSTRSPT